MKQIKQNKEALNYLKEWGGDFWINTDKNFKEITQQLEGRIQASVKSIIPNFSINNINKISHEQKEQITERANKVVNDYQIGKLNKLLNLFKEEIFYNEKDKYYILIDQLDENWARIETRCRFINALFKEIVKFRNVRYIKIITTIRTDLLELVLQKIDKKGYQQDKFESSKIILNWSKIELEELVKTRIKKAK